MVQNSSKTSHDLPNDSPKQSPKNPPPPQELTRVTEDVERRSPGIPQEFSYICRGPHRRVYEYSSHDSTKIGKLLADLCIIFQKSCNKIPAVCLGEINDFWRDVSDGLATLLQGFPRIQWLLLGILHDCDSLFYLILSEFFRINPSIPFGMCANVC